MSSSTTTADTSASSYAAKLLMRELQHIQKEYGSDSENDHSGLPDIECSLVDDNLFEWMVTLVFMSEFEMYQGAVLKARLSFPPNFPMMPPKMKFLSKMFHPNSMLFFLIFLCYTRPSSAPVLLELGEGSGRDT